MDPNQRTAFHRHSRPQLPAGVPKDPHKQRLAIKSTPSWLPRCPSKDKHEVISVKQSRPRIEVSSGWKDYRKLGTLIQGSAQYIVAQDRAKRLVMFKTLDSRDSTSLAQSLEHDNLLVSTCLIQEDMNTLIGFDYTRFTLEELLNTHLSFDEDQIRLFSKSVFNALIYLNNMNLGHGSINPSTIRVRGHPIAVVLADCESCVASTPTLVQKYVDDFGLLLLDCMAQPRKRGVATASQVRENRTQNQFFGLSNAERWSANQELVDFVDNIFKEEPSASAKFGRRLPPESYGPAWNPNSIVRDCLFGMPYIVETEYAKRVLEMFRMLHAILIALRCYITRLDMNDPHTSSYLTSHGADTPLEASNPTDLDPFIDFSPMFSAGNSAKPVTGNPESYASAYFPGRVSMFEKQMSDIRGENNRLKQQLRQPGCITGARSIEGHDRPLQPHLSHLAKLTGLNEQESFIPSIGEVIDPSSLTATSASQTAKSQNFGLLPEFTHDPRPQPSNIEQTSRSRAKTHFSRPFRSSSRTAIPESSSSPHLGTDGMSSQRKSGDQKSIEILRAELESNRDELRQLQKRCSETEAKLAQGAIQMDQDRDERYCEYFDWIFEFAVETFNLLKQQDVELPPKLVNVYNIICNVGT